MKFLNCILVLSLLVTGGLVSNNCRADLVFDFSNTAPISIPSEGVANPYPSPIAVSGVTGVITDISITLDGFSHTFPDDVGAVIVSPTGDAVLLFSGPGDGTSASDLTWVFNDSALFTLPEEGALTSGIFQPGLEQYDEDFPAPGPGGKQTDTDPPPWGFEFTPLFADDPNGDWNLFVQDSLGGDSGQIARGWSITITSVPEPSSILSLVALMGCFQFGHRRRKM